MISLEIPSSSSKKLHQAKIKVKWKKMTSCYTMNKFSKSITSERRTRNTPSDFGKGLCLSMVHNGINPMISRRSIVLN